MDPFFYPKTVEFFFDAVNGLQIQLKPNIFKIKFY